MEMPTKKNNPETESPEEELAQSEPVPAKRGVAATFRDAFRRAKERQQSSSAAAETAKARSELSRDKTKTLFAMVAAIVALLIVFLGLFSSSHDQVQREQAARRGKPSLGRPETGTETRPPGSVTPMLSAEMAGQEPPTDEVTPEDVNNTSRQKIGDSRIATRWRSSATITR